MILFTPSCLIRCLQCDIVNYLYPETALMELVQTFATGAWQIPRIQPSDDPCPLRAVCYSYPRLVSSWILQECAIAREEVIASLP